MDIKRYFIDQLKQVYVDGELEIIDTAVYYPRPVDAQPMMGGLSRCPNAQRFCDTALAIPVHAELHPDEHERVLTALQRWV